MKRLLAVFLVLSLGLSLVACAGDGGKTTTTSPTTTKNGAAESETAQPADPTKVKYNIGYNNLGAGVWSLDHTESECRNMVETILGMTLTAKSADFTADQLQIDCQSLISSGINGMMYFGTFNTLTPAISDLFKETKTPFAMWDQMPYDEGLNAVMSNPYFAGAFGSDHYSLGASQAIYAYEAGCRNALVLSGAVGDTAQDNRTKGFSDKFAELGGKVLMVTRCGSTSEATEKADDLVAAYTNQVDCTWGGQADYALALYNACVNFGISEKVKYYCCDMNQTLLEYVRKGIVSSDCGIKTASLAATLLINYLDGHPILDPNGKAPIFYLGAFQVTAENADEFARIWYEEYPFTMAVYEKLLWRFNPDVSYQTYVDFINNYSWEYVKSLH